MKFILSLVSGVIVETLVLLVVRGIIESLVDGDHVATGTYALALVTLILAGVAFLEMREGRERAQETQRASFRPLVIPIGSLGLNPFSDMAAFWSALGHTVEIKNVGSGVATNVRGVILPSTYIGRVFSMDLFCPVAKDETLQGHFKAGAIQIEPGDQIEGFSLFAPQDPYYYFRLSLTYWDIFGFKHTSIFDHTMNRVWKQVAIRNEILHDLAEIDAVNQSKHHHASQPDSQTGEDWRVTLHQD
jgi:hypothetical protein